MAEKSDNESRSAAPEELRSLLAQLGLTQADLARRFGTVRATPNHWLAGNAPIPPWVPEHLRALLALRDLCALIPAAPEEQPEPEPVAGPVPARLAGLSIDGQPVIPADLGAFRKRNIARDKKLASNKQTATIAGMDRNPEPMSADAFKEALQELGWTQSHFASVVGCTVGTASRWAHGNAIPPWVPVHLGLLLQIKRLHARFVEPEGGRGSSGP